MERTIIAAFALATASLPAHASTTPIDVRAGPATASQVQAGGDTGFSVSGPTDYQDLRFTTKAGGTYWLGLAARGGGHAVVTGPGGARVAAFDLGYHDTDNQSGAEVRSTTGGVYTMRVWLSPGADTGTYPAPGYAWLWTDCLGNPASGCTIGTPQTRVGSWGGFNDRDAFRITAPAGSKLTATLAITGGQYIARYAVVSKAGTVLTQGITGLTGATRFRRTWSFTLPSSGGPWYLTTTATSASRRGRGTYTLSLR
jgi:hypothetical protein